MEQVIPMQIDVTKTFKNTSGKVLDFLVDSMFEFVDQEFLLSQSNFGPVNELGGEVAVTSGIRGKIPDDFPEGIYIRNGQAKPSIWGIEINKICVGKVKAPGSEELIILGVDAVKPFMEIGIISADGKELIHKADLKLNRCSICHELGVTERLVEYNHEGCARIGVMPRYVDADSVRWFKVEPNCTFHIINSFEDGDEVVVWACKALDSVIPGPDMALNQFGWLRRKLKPTSTSKENDISPDEGNLLSHAYEWRLNMQSGEVNEKYLTGKRLSMDFPMINGAFSGYKNRYGDAQVVDSVASSASGMLKYSGLRSQLEEETKVENHMFEENSFCSGASFVPNRRGLEEDDGWVITFVHNEDTKISQVYVIDTKKISSEPVAQITLPCRVPYGFHGAFKPISSST
ncbi:unnamed protein product [Malus baccata var. baccata]